MAKSRYSWVRPAFLLRRRWDAPGAVESAEAPAAGASSIELDFTIPIEVHASNQRGRFGKLRDCKKVTNS